MDSRRGGTENEGKFTKRKGGVLYCWQQVTNGSSRIFTSTYFTIAGRQI
jgi:hypothetical protein